MAINADPEIPKNINAQPGVDHHDFDNQLIKNVSKEVGGPVNTVTPLTKVAEDIINSANEQFIQDVAGVVQTEPTTNPADSQHEGFSNVKEIFNAYNPLLGSDNKEITDRTAPGKKPLNLEQIRNEKINQMKKAA